MSYTNCLPGWTVGNDYKEVYNIVRRYGSKAVIIGGKTALEKAAHLIEGDLKISDFEIKGVYWYGGDTTYENVQKLEAIEEIQNAHMIFAVGGGRAIDLCKAVAQNLDKPLFTFPTIASNCAACTSIAVFYNADGTFKDYYYTHRCPEHTFINTNIIAESPEEFLWAGIGDGLSKECEVELGMRGEDTIHTTLLGKHLAHTCTQPLITYGAKAMEECKNNATGRALEEVTLAIIISTGVVSNCTAHPTDYYYNSSLAHCVYYGATLIPESGHKHLHGEIVSYGVLTLLQYDNNIEERDRIMEFNHSIGLPITLDEIGMTNDDLQIVADKASTVLEWNKAPYQVTKEKFIEAMLVVDEAGRAYHKLHTIL